MTERKRRRVSERERDARRLNDGFRQMADDTERDEYETRRDNRAGWFGFHVESE